MKYHKDVKRWRVFWHITLPNGEVDKGSKSFKEKKLAPKFKDQIEKREKRLKQAVIAEVPYLGSGLRRGDNRMRGVFF